MPTEQDQLEQIFREEWGRILATPIRVLGSFDLAEEAAQEAFAARLRSGLGRGFRRIRAHG